MNGWLNDWTELVPAGAKIPERLCEEKATYADKHWGTAVLAISNMANGGA